MTWLSEAVFWISAATLGLGDRSREGTRARAHLYGTVTCRSHVRVHAHSAIHVDGQARWALAAEGPLRVDAAAVHADARRLTLVYV